MTTALDTITGAMRLLNVIAANETATGSDAALGLQVLNEMLEDWSTQDMAIYTPVDQQFVLIPGTATYTLGPTGTWVGFRPIKLDQARVTWNLIDYSVPLIDNASYNNIAFKLQTGVLPLALNFTGNMPNAMITLWPIPTQALPIFITSDQLLAQIPAVTTVLSLPPGYSRALRFNLAKDLQDEYGKQMTDTALQLADRALGHIKRANISPVPANFDPAFTDGGGTGSYLANFIAGN